MALNTCAAVMMLFTWKVPRDCGRYWIVHGPFELQLPPSLATVLQSVVYHGPLELEFAKWFFQ